MKQSYATPEISPEAQAAVLATGSGEVVVRLHAAQTFHHSGDQLGPAGAPAVAPITEVQEVSCPAGLRFGSLDATTTRVGGYSDGWSYTAQVTTEFVARDEANGVVRMTVEIDSLTWVGPSSVAHPILGVFDVSYREDLTLRCVPAV